MYLHSIENFVYTMAKFEVSSCTIMVCVSDPLCMKLCAESSFPCYDYQHSAYHPVSTASWVIRIRICLPKVQLYYTTRKVVHDPILTLIPYLLFFVLLFIKNEPLPSALEQIGELKLLHLPKALAKGVSAFTYIVLLLCLLDRWLAVLHLNVQPVIVYKE